MKTLELSNVIFDYVKSRCETGLPPTIREICSALSIKSTSTAHKYVKILVEEGKIEKDNNLTRQLKIPGMRSVMVPFFRKITKGTDYTKPDGYIPFLPPKKSETGMFAIQLENEELAAKDLHKGDLLILKKAVNSDKNNTVRLQQIGMYVELLGMVRLYSES